jgi:lipopolysaccharide/colanic/teichoic acid biosynthesis glycosyltransferase
VKTNAERHDALAANSALYLPERSLSRVTDGLKRVFDLVIAVLGLMLAAPLFLIIAILIKLDSPGPVLFPQVRVGRHRRRFRMWKFRKMSDKLEKPGPSLTRRHDHRLTAVGRFLERTKLDELPQLLNVLWGDMSIVGPRPEVPKFIEHYPDRWDVVLSVKPGLFGPTQLRYRNESELYPPNCENVEAFYVRYILPAKLELDAEYARSIGVVHDLALLVRCTLVIFSGAITWETLSIRRWQILNLIILSVLGVCGMVVANGVTVGRLDRSDMFCSIVLAAGAKFVCLLAFKVPKALATSMTADDFLRIWWCALTSAALIVTGMLLLDRRDFSRLVLLLDTTLFVSLLLIYKLLLFKVYVSLSWRGSHQLSRRLVYASLVLAPLSLSAMATFRHGMDAWSGASLPLYLTLLPIVTVIRPMVVLLTPIYPRPTAFSWFVREGMKLALGTLVGSAIVASAAVVVNESGVGHGDLLCDAALYQVGMTCVASWYHGRLNEGKQCGSAAERAATPATEKILVVGSGIGLSCFVAALAELPDFACEVVGIVTPHHYHRTSTVGGYPIIGHIQDIPELLDRTDISRVVIVTCAIDQASLEELSRRCRGREDRFTYVEMLAPLLRWRSETQAATGQPPLQRNKDHSDWGNSVDQLTVR